MEKLNEAATGKTNGASQNEPSEQRKGIVENLKETGKERLANEKQAAAEQAEKLADVVEKATEELARVDFASIGGYANQLASMLKKFADKLHTSSVEDLLDETRRAARRNPELFFLGSIAAGVALSRFFKASQRYEQQASRESSWRGTARADDDDRRMMPTRADTYAAGDSRKGF